ncbi:DNA polymerase III subunit alpha [Thermoactinomyces sp. DSM 45892]|uniref:DNA polymerase III subunit alpha n=1 Tax=Thermoactinomyces sp. DSM 45892 TaxID=1882753 RepID=UPI0008980724|nr:DNA polymerase III subunit alpha [Thermoactinomyces sp. DSM 45892]SDX97225.1 DNA polymerase-3 subunit alpha [Thermoactinomyces sp. DSM 45892]
MDNYTVYHIHSDLSNLTAGTGADSVTKFVDYLDLAEKYGMNSFCFSEHGNQMNWIKKKQGIEKRGMKYIHGNEVYLTRHTDKQQGLIRDNYHYMLIAKNYEGVKELNTLTSKSFNRQDGHFYYNPRISFEELKSTSDNIIMTSACLASPLWRMYKNPKLKNELEDMLQWMGDNRHRMFLEIQYHTHPEQFEFNKLLHQWSKDLQIPLIAGTDTHALNREHQEARKIFLQSKGATYGNEDMFDLTFKSFQELVGMFESQRALPRNVYLEAIHNTNSMADMVEEFSLDKTPKYPKLYENPIEVFKQKINDGVVKRGIHQFPKEKRNEYYDRIKEEIDTYIKLDSVDYMLLQKKIIDWCHENEIYQGYGRGSVNGSLIAYVLGITEMDSIKHKLNFFRFLNPDRVSLPDIDIDFPPSRRQDVIDYLSGLDGVEFAEIITFNTLADKGSIREVGRALDMSLDVVDHIAKNIETDEKKFRKEYPDLFQYVDVLKGVIQSMGSHPSGFVVSPIDLDKHLGTVYTKESKHRVTSVNMKELDGENYVKLDILGLDNIELINETCKLAGIERLIPDNIDTSDLDVWKTLRESTLGVFQFEGDSAHAYLKTLFSDETLEKIHHDLGEVDYIDLLSLANGAIRPSGESYRYDLAKGITKDNGHEGLNQFLSETLGYMVFQEQIMRFLTDFCGFSGAESDSVRRGLAKKVGTEQFLPAIEAGFIETMRTQYDEDEEHAKQILQSFLKVIEDASDYGFSVNHSQPYSYIGYIGAYLRHHYPLEFLTVALNLRGNDLDKTTKIVHYAKQKRIEIKPIQFGKSRSVYSFSKDEQAIYKGIQSIKYLNAKVAEELYELAKKDYDRDNFVMLVVDMLEHTTIDTRQMEILIRLDFFQEFGRQEVLLEISKVMMDRKKPDGELYPEFVTVSLKYTKGHKEKTKQQRIANLENFEKAVRDHPPQKVSLHEQISFEKETLGYAVSTFEDVSESFAVVLDIDKKFTPKIVLYRVKTGEESVLKVNKKKFYQGDDDLLYVGDVIQILETAEKNGWKNVNGKWVQNPEAKDIWLEKCKLIRKSKERDAVLDNNCRSIV